jgi:tRNA(Ile2) C34 agmatinyltransferase TiaS
LKSVEVFKLKRDLTIRIESLKKEHEELSNITFEPTDSYRDKFLYQKYLDAINNLIEESKCILEELEYRYCSKCGTELIDVGKNRPYRRCPECVRRERS